MAKSTKSTKANKSSKANGKPRKSAKSVSKAKSGAGVSSDTKITSPQTTTSASNAKSDVNQASTTSSGAPEADQVSPDVLQLEVPTTRDPETTTETTEEKVDALEQPDLSSSVVGTSDVVDKRVGVPAMTAPPLPSPARATKRVWHVTRTRIIIGTVLLLLVVGGLLVLNHTRNNLTATEAANKALIAEISQRAVLPKGEKPTITTVVDKNKAKQTFLINAANGDKVLLYLQSGRAILYRPSTHQIVNMGPLTQPPARVFVRNGTVEADIPSSTLGSLRAQAGFTVVSQDLSTKPTYANTLVVDLTGSRPDLANRLAKSINAKVAKLPDGESPPEADVLVIVGADAK